MKRYQFIEIEDKEWCPGLIRDGLTDVLMFYWNYLVPLNRVVQLLKSPLKSMKTNKIVDLCSGGGGPWLRLSKVFQKNGIPVNIILTDLYPNKAAFSYVNKKSQGFINYYPEPVNAANVPKNLNGFRTIFGAFHHFPPESAKAILEDCIQKKQGIAIFEFTDRNIVSILCCLLSPASIWLFTPFIRPFKISRLFFTYIVPLIPLVTFFDGIVSCIRTYTAKELSELVANNKDYIWETGKKFIFPFPIPLTYYIFYPACFKQDNL
jgi:hypothetical protein